MSRTKRQFVLSRSAIRELFNIPNSVDISAVQSSQEPLQITITLTGDESLWYSEEGEWWYSEDNESRIIPMEFFYERDDDNQG